MRLTRGAVTLEAYTDIYTKLAGRLADTPVGAAPENAPAPPDLTLNAISLQVRDEHARTARGQRRLTVIE